MRNKIISYQNKHNNIIKINQLNAISKPVYEIIVIFYILSIIFV